MRSAGTAVTRCINIDHKQKEHSHLSRCKCPKVRGSIMPFDVHNTEHVHNHVNMLQINSLHISVKQCGSSWDLTTGICKYGLALAFPKVPEQPGCPLTFEPCFTGKQR